MARTYLGFTLLELMVYLTLVAILSTLALPSAKAWLTRIRVQTVTGDIAMAVRYARVRAYTDGTNYALTGRPDWSTGMVLFEDMPTHQVIRTWQWPSSDLHVTWHGFRGNTALIFSKDPRHAASSGHFVIEAAGISKQLVVNRLGRVVEVKK